MFEFSSRVRFSEIGPDRRMTVPSLISRLQDCGVFHLDSVGRGPEVWAEEKRGWIIVSWQVKILQLPKFGNVVTARTIPYRFHGFEGDRNYEILAAPYHNAADDAGEGGTEPVLCAVANSRWVFYDMEKQAPMRVPKEEVDRIALDPPLDMEYSPRRIRLPELQPEPAEPLRVTNSFIDTNRHVNNLKYIEIACSYLPDDFEMKELRVEYLRQCRLGEVIYPGTYRTDEALYVSLGDEEGKPYAVVMFL